MKLDKEQVRINRLWVIISNKDKLQFYTERINVSNCFNKKEMVDWENKPIHIKDDYNKAKLYFKGLIRDFETYTQNSGGNSGKMGYESANQMTDVGDEIQKYIQEIASATVASNKKTTEWAASLSKEAKAKDAKINAMTAQIQALTTTVATLLKAITAAAKENLNPNTGDGNSGGNGIGGNSNGGNSRGSNSNGRLFQITLNMGGYCFTCGHHPVGANHTSATCKQKRKGHNDSATATNCMDGSTRRPGIRKVKPSKKNHPSYKGQSAPN
jgi:hypothetical protein